jgi:hypothetical protein
LFDVAVHDLQADELVVGGSASGNEEEGGVTTVDYFLIWEPRTVSDTDVDPKSMSIRTFVFQKVAHACASREDNLRDIFDDLGFFLGRKGGEPLGQTLCRFCMSMSCEVRRWATRPHTTLPCLDSRMR